MRIRLGVIAPEVHIDSLKIIKEEFKEICDIKFLIVNDIMESDELYLMNKDKVDGFIFSGIYIKEAIDKDHFDMKIPYSFLNNDENILYKELFRLLLTKPDLDISRVYIDFAYVLDSFKEFRGYLTNQGKPLESEDIFKNINTLLENHVTLWEENKIDLSITAMGHFISEFKRHGIKYIYIRPPLEQMREIFKRIIDEITIIKLKKSRTVAAYISTEYLGESENGLPFKKSLQEIINSIKDFLRSNNLVFNAQIVSNHIQAYMAYSDFLKITSDIQSCSLLDYLVSGKEYALKIGWGAGREFYQAKENAEKANRQAKAYNGSCSFFIDDDQKVIGPLRKTNKIQFSEQCEPEIMILAQNIDMNNINLQRIISHSERIGTNKLSSADVAQCLSITIRGANRILNKIEQKNFATAIYEKRENSKGRPKKYYELIFLDKKGNLVSGFDTT